MYNRLFIATSFNKRVEVIMNAFPTERNIRLVVNALIDKYEIDLNILKNFVGNQNFNDLNKMLKRLEEGEMDVYKLARLIIVNKGPYLFAGSNKPVRDFRRILL